MILIKWLVSIVFLLNLNVSLGQVSIVKSVKVGFKIKNAGVFVNGTFDNVEASVFIDKAVPSKSSFIGTVYTNTVNTGIALRDKHLRNKEDFFNSQKYPAMTMKSVLVELKKPGVYSVTWDLTIKNIVKRVTSEVLTTVKGDLILLSTQININRNDWKVGGSSFFMSDNVLVSISAVIEQ